MKKYLSHIIVAIVCLAVGFGSGYEYMAYRVKSALAQAIKPLAQLSNGGTGTIDSPTPSPALKMLTAKVGQELNSQNLVFTATGAELKDTITPPFGNPINARGKFLIVHLSVTSKLKENWTLSPDDIWTVLDDKKRQFKLYNVIGAGLPDSLLYR